MTAPPAPDLWFPNPLAGTKTLVPWKARLSSVEPGILEWRTISLGGHHGLEAGDSVAGCINAFVRLADASDEAFPPFALRWGVIGGACGDMMGPVSPPPGGWWTWDEEPLRPWARESIAVWRRLAVEVRTVLELAEELRAGRPKWSGTWPPPEHALAGPDPRWEIVTRRTQIGRPPPWPRLAGVITEWLRDAAVHPALKWDGVTEAWRMRLELGDPSVRGLAGLPPRGQLYGVVVTQLAAAVLAEGIYRCDRCGSSYVPDDPEAKRPRGDRRRFCGYWCRQEQARENKRKWARKNYIPKKTKEKGHE